jgi:hypothetical protein
MKVLVRMLMALAASLLIAGAGIPDGECRIPADRRGNTDWFSEAGWGIFVHYLWDVQNAGKRPANMGKLTDWDTCVKEFDTEKFASQIEQTGAHYVIVTMMQRTRYLIAPNATYDRFTGYRPGEACSTRDLVEDLYQSLHKRGIVLMLYWTGDGPRQDPQAAKGLGYGGGTPTAFVRNWAEVAAEYGRRYGEKVAGYWADGCYTHTGYNEEKWAILAGGLRAGNPRRIIALNSPSMRLANSCTPDDDFTTGEVNSFGETSAFRWRDGVQWHVLSHLGGDWCSPGVRYSSDWMADYIRRANFSGGVISVDVLLFRDGSIDKAQSDCLKAANEKMRALATGRPIPPGNLAFGKPANHLYADGHQTRGVVGANYAMNGVDGNSNTIAQASGKGQDPVEWAYEVDLLKQATISRIVVAFGKEENATHFRLQMSENGTDWRDVDGTPVRNAATAEIRFAPVTARYVRIVQHRQGTALANVAQMQVAELEVYEAGPTGKGL